MSSHDLNQRLRSVQLADAQAGLGLVPAVAATAIRAHARVELLDLEEVAAGIRATGHSTLGLIRCLRTLLPPDAAEWVYYGATVQDVTDTWFALVSTPCSTSSTATSPAARRPR